MTVQWNEAWSEETWEEAILHHSIIRDLIYAEMTKGVTSTGFVPEWIDRAAQAVVREYMCKRCGYGLPDLGVHSSRCNDCAPQIAAEERNAS